MIDPRRLRVLQAVAASGSVAAAAQALHLTPPAVSQQLIALERETGASLIDRSGRQVTLTAAGRLLAGHANSAAVTSPPSAGLASAIRLPRRLRSSEPSPRRASD
jgi:DNA-binding transcriptional LysR family regulator